MREIKFRVVNRDTKEIVGYEWLWAGSCKWQHRLADGGLVSNGVFLEHKVNKIFDRYQFTGLFDKHGKEIYEGDTLKCEWQIEPEVDGQKPIFETWRGPVIYDEGGFYVETAGYGAIPASEYVELGCEVIGNIWENKDLLP
jgi:uncharacterized phage protein (TIGR01671 family)